MGRGDWRGWGKDRRRVEKDRQEAERKPSLLCLWDQPVMGQKPRQFYVPVRLAESEAQVFFPSAVVAGHIKKELGPCETLQVDEAKATFRKRNNLVLVSSLALEECLGKSGVKDHLQLHS